MFQTERLSLRAMEASDVANVGALMNDARVQPLISFDYLAPHSTTGKWMKNFVAAMDSEKVVSLIMERKDDTRKFVGHLSLGFLVPKNRTAEVGIMITPRWQSVGYGTEAMKWVVDYVFRDLGLHRLQLVVFGSNSRAIDLYERIGFKHEGSDRKANWIQGKWEDVIHMGILEEDWNEKKKLEQEGWVDIGQNA